MKNIKIILFSSLFICNYFSVFSQYTDVINSNKPGFSESPYSVGSGIYQFESSFFYRNTEISPTFSRPQSIGVDLLFRTSFFLDRLELNTQIAYQRDKIAFQNIFSSSHFVSGLSRATVGAKYLLFQQEFTDKSKEVKSWKRRHAFDKKRLIPSVALYVGVNTDFVSQVHKTGSITPKVGILLQNDLSNYFNIITNFYYDNIGSDFSEYSYVITGTYNFEGRWSVFIENQAIFQKYKTNINLGTGLAFLFNQNFQINSSIRALFEGENPGFYTGLGISYRINRHHDTYKELDDTGKEIKDSPISRYNKKQKGFFNKITNIFKKKGKVKEKRVKPSRSRQKPTKKRKKKTRKKRKKKEDNN